MLCCCGSREPRARGCPPCSAGRSRTWLRRRSTPRASSCPYRRRQRRHLFRLAERVLGITGIPRAARSPLEAICRASPPASPSDCRGSTVAASPALQYHQRIRLHPGSYRYVSKELIRNHSSQIWPDNQGQGGAPGRFVGGLHALRPAPAAVAPGRPPQSAPLGVESPSGRAVYRAQGCLRQMSA